MSTSITTTKSTNEELQSQATRYQQLKLRKEALEKKLNEKYEQLHQICQNEATLIGNNLDLNTSQTNGASSQSTLRRKIGTNLKLTEHIVENQNQDEINRLLLQRQMQQQISQASFRIANDPLQSKSIRRTHRQTYETSQQKLAQLNEEITMVQRQRAPTRPLSQDDIDLHHRSENRYVKNALAIVGNNAKNLQLLNANNAMSERRNSMKSTTSSLGSSNTFIVQASPSSASSLTSLKTIPNNGNMESPRTRHDSSSNRFDYDFHHKNESPTPSNFSLQSPQIINNQIPLCSQSLKNIKINTDNHSVSSQEFYNNFTNQQNQFLSSPQFANQPHLSPQGRVLHPSDNKFIHRLHSFHQQFQHDMQQKHMMVAKEALQEDLRMRQHLKTQTLNNNHSPNHYTPAHSAGLGGFWTINENNQRMWIPDSKYPLSPPQTNMSKKSNSLGNFEFMHKHDNEQHDSVSISSGNSNDHKKKEKVWVETSLDGGPAVTEPKQYRPRVESPTSTDLMNNNHQVYESPQSPSRTIQQQIMAQHFQQQNSNNYLTSNGHMKIQHQTENIYLNPLANTNANPPNIPPKSKLRYSESTRSTMSNRDIENNVIPQMQHALPIQVESPKNVTIIQEGSWKPYKEEIKSYEISDFYKYSQKYRQQQQQKQNNIDC